MRDIPKQQVIARLASENPWWRSPHQIDRYYRTMKRRAYFASLERLVRQTTLKRAVVLMGPRRVGKTVMLYQMVQRLIEDGIDPKRICYFSVEHPIYNGLGLEELFEHCREAVGADSADGFYLFFDEIQYLRDWELHLKTLVDKFNRTKFVASGSAAAALKLKSLESGAGRFTDFLLPPLTFHEYIDLLEKTSLIKPPANREESGFFDSYDIAELNRLFLDYLNFGGYPEVIFSDSIKADPGRYIRSDIIDKVLLRDLPGLYGIQDIQELNSLFTVLAFNTANECSLEALSQKSGVAKNTIKRYIEYLEAAFLIKRVERIDRDGRRFQRASQFKVYLTNPSIRAALFSPLKETDDDIGSLVESAVFSQWFHSDMRNIYYARWKEGEVDLVSSSLVPKVDWLTEVKWSDSYPTRLNELKAVLDFCKLHEAKNVTVTTVSVSDKKKWNDVEIDFLPASLYCYTVGYNLVANRALPSRARRRPP